MTLNRIDLCRLVPALLATFALLPGEALADSCLIYVDAESSCDPTAETCGSLVAPYPDLQDATDAACDTALSACGSRVISVAPGTFSGLGVPAAGDGFDALIACPDVTIAPYDTDWVRPVFAWDATPYTPSSTPLVEADVYDGAIRVARGSIYSGSSCMANDNVDSGPDGTIDGTSSTDFNCPLRNITIEGLRLEGPPATGIYAGHTVNLRLDQVEVVQSGLGAVAVSHSFMATLSGATVEEAHFLASGWENVRFGRTFGYVLDDNTVADAPTVCMRAENLEDYYSGWGSALDYVEVAGCCDSGVDCYPEVGALYAGMSGSDVTNGTAPGIDAVSTRFGLIIENEVSYIGHGAGIYVDAWAGIDLDGDDSQGQPGTGEHGTAGTADVDLVANRTHNNAQGGIHIGSEHCGAVESLRLYDNVAWNENHPIKLEGAYDSAACGGDYPELTEFRDVHAVNNTLHGCFDDDVEERVNAGQSCYFTPSSPNTLDRGVITMVHAANANWDPGDDSYTLFLYNNLTANGDHGLVDLSVAGFDDDDDGLIDSAITWVYCATNLAQGTTDSTNCTDWLPTPFAGGTLDHDVTNPDTELAVDPTSHAANDIGTMAVTTSASSSTTGSVASNLDGFDQQERDDVDPGVDIGADEAD